MDYLNYQVTKAERSLFVSLRREKLLANLNDLLRRHQLKYLGMGQVNECLKCSRPVEQQEHVI